MCILIFDIGQKIRNKSFCIEVDENEEIFFFYVVY